MDSNKCVYKLQKSARQGQLCGHPVVVNEKFCMVCIIRESCEDQVSEKFKNYLDNLDLIPLPLARDKFFMSLKYAFIIDYNGEFHLKGIFDGFEEDGINYKIREANEEEREVAVREGILIIRN